MYPWPSVPTMVHASISRKLAIVSEFEWSINESIGIERSVSACMRGRYCLCTIASPSSPRTTKGGRSHSSRCARDTKGEEIYGVKTIPVVLNLFDRKFYNGLSKFTHDVRLRPE